ncbi:sulfotransferase domain-containing protein [Microbulbifer sp. TRSA005]|uniref:sulfotransferase domain-containing protein n=1 Tax=Microbulbifer sp. TRSA005 TaxID=3243383 RepID=UPI0040393C3A
MITPIMLRSFGRSGSTLLMQVLGSSNNVVFDRHYPFEKRHLTYLCRLSGLVGKDTANDSDWNPDSIFNRELNKVGPIPYSEVSIFDRSELSKDFLKRLWNGFSTQVKKANSDIIDSNNPVYYAEKVVHDICSEVNNVIAAKNLFLLRDPRDEFLSIKSFNKKRGFNGFGWEESDTDESYAIRLCKMRKSFMRHVANMECDDRRYFIKYEDFMLSPFDKTNDISEWLGLTLDYNQVLANRSSVDQHITAPESVIRWKSEMDSSLCEIFNEHLGEELNSLGYEV